VSKPNDRMISFLWKEGGPAEEIEKGLADLRSKVQAVDLSTHEFLELELPHSCWRCQRIEIEGAPARRVEGYDPVRGVYLCRIDVLVRPKAVV